MITDTIFFSKFDFQNDKSLRHFLKTIIIIAGISEVISSEFMLEESLDEFNRTCNTCSVYTSTNTV